MRPNTTVNVLDRLDTFTGQQRQDLSPVKVPNLSITFTVELGLI